MTAQTQEELLASHLEQQKIDDDEPVIEDEDEDEEDEDDKDEDDNEDLSSSELLLRIIEKGKAKRNGIRTIPVE